MRARSFSHCGITVSDFNRAVRFYWDVFRCPLVGVSDQPPDRVRAFFGVDAEQPTCKVGWIRVPGGAVLELQAALGDAPPAGLWADEVLTGDADVVQEDGVLPVTYEQVHVLNLQAFGWNGNHKKPQIPVARGIGVR